MHTGEARLQASTPYFFRHLPKTAGTSLITTLSNVFGDARCHRFGTIGPGFRDECAGTLAERGDTLSLVSGHVPLSLVEEGASGTELTVLREPIARLLSMRRFFQGLPAGERARLGFGDRVTTADLLASTDPEIYGQVRHGLTRFFCGSTPFADALAPEYRDPAPAPAVTDACMAALSRIAVGTVEDMPATLRRIGRLLRVPYDLELPVENATEGHLDDVSLADMAALVGANTADIAVYHVARHRLATWSPASSHLCAADVDPRTLFDPQPRGVYDPPHIPGRQGFAPSAAVPPLCWIGATGRGRIHLAPSSRTLALTLVFYGVVPHYPMEDVVFTVDERHWAFEQRIQDGHGVFALAAIPPHAGPLELAIVQPCAVPVPLIDPESPDRRSLGMALAQVSCEDA